MPILFDLQIEAEILGCEMKWTKNNPPSVKTHPLEADPTLPCSCRIPTEESGRVPIALEATRRVKEAIGDKTAIYGLICGPFTLASHLRGSNIFMSAYASGIYALFEVFQPRCICMDISGESPVFLRIIVTVESEISAVPE